MVIQNSIAGGEFSPLGPVAIQVDRYRSPSHWRLPNESSCPIANSTRWPFRFRCLVQFGKSHDNRNIQVVYDLQI